MTESKWPTPVIRRGVITVQPFQLRLAPALINALKRYSVEESENEGRSITAANIAATTMLRGDKRLRQLYKEELKKETLDAIEQDTNTEDTTYGR